MKFKLILKSLFKVPLILLCLAGVVYVLGTGQSKELLGMLAFSAAIGFFTGLSWMMDIVDYRKFTKLSSELNGKIHVRTASINGLKDILESRVYKAREVVKCQRVLDNIKEYETTGFLSIKQSLQLLENLRELGETHPKIAISDFALVGQLNVGDSEMVIRKILDDYIAAEKRLPSIKETVELNIQTFKSELERLAWFGYKIDLVQEFAEVDRMVAEANVFLEANTYDPQMYIQTIYDVPLFLGKVLNRYTTLEELRENNDAQIKLLETRLNNARELMGLKLTKNLELLVNFPEPVWRDAKARIEELMSNEWVTFLFSKLREATQLNSLDVLEPTLAKTEIDIVEKTLVDAEAIIQKPEQILNDLDKAEDACVVKLRTIADSLPSMDFEILQPDVTESLKEKFSAFEKSYKTLKSSLGTGQYQDWFEVERKVDDLSDLLEELREEISDNKMDAEGRRAWADRGSSGSNECIGLST